MVREDSKRPDGMMVLPLRVGKSLIWDVIPSLGITIKSATDPVIVARLTEDRFRTDFLFVPIAIEASGVLGPKIASLLCQTGLTPVDLRIDRQEVSVSFLLPFLTITHF